jgi:GNAT superfamily N-acetyltransferase
VDLRTVRPVGTAYLDLVTELLQRQRLADDLAGLWEAADLQWWFTRDPHPTDRDAVFWLDGAGVPVVAAVFTRWSPGRYGCDVLGLSSYGPAWSFVRRRCGELGDATVEMEIAPGTEAQVESAGFAELVGAYDVAWLDAADRRTGRPLPDGYALVARPEQSGPHPMVRRNGSEVEARLRQCSLYDAHLDLAVLAPGGEIAGYAMFWADVRTGVGLVEPMRVEEEHAGRGVASALLGAGLDRLAVRGCRRLKVSHEVDNQVAARLYRGAGFVPQMRVQVRARPPARTPT